MVGEGWQGRERDSIYMDCREGARESEHEHIGDGKSDMEEGGGEGAKGGKESDDIYMDC